jgi:hypothetical protein
MKKCQLARSQEKAIAEPLSSSHRQSSTRFSVGILTKILKRFCAANDLPKTFKVATIAYFVSVLLTLFDLPKDCFPNHFIYNELKFHSGLEFLQNGDRSVGIPYTKSR